MSDASGPNSIIDMLIVTKMCVCATCGWNHPLSLRALFFVPRALAPTTTSQMIFPDYTWPAGITPSTRLAHHARILRLSPKLSQPLFLLAQGTVYQPVVVYRLQYIDFFRSIQ